MADGKIAHVDVFRDGTKLREHEIAQGRHLIGRNLDAEICLDHPTVSRPHAELICGPFGRWWIHDLASTNGVYVNGARARERMLNPGDRIGIGEFTLQLGLFGAVEAARPSLVPASVLSAELEEEEATQIALIPLPENSAQVGAKHLASIMELGRLLSALEGSAERLATLCQSLVGPDFPIDSAVVLRLTGAGNTQVLSGPYRRFGPQAVGPYLSTTVLESLWEKRQPVLASNITNDNGAASELSLAAAVRPLSVVACPLVATADSLDLLYVEYPAFYATEEWRSMTALVAEAYKQAGLVWEMKRYATQSARIGHELEMARHIQARYLPDCSRIEPLAVAVGYEPCRWVGGDYVDAVPMPDGRILLAIGDVCGKGMQAALVSSSVYTLIRATVEARGSLPSLMRRANRFLCEHLPEDSFVTLLCVAIEPETGEIECVNAGHPAAVLISRQGSVTPLQAESNLALGIMETEFVPQRSRLAHDEILLLFTDGLTEAMDDERRPLDLEQIAGALARVIPATALPDVELLRDKVSEVVNQYRSAQLAVDDTTFVVARRRSERERAAIRG